jgi:hypothetical protein
MSESHRSRTTWTVDTLDLLKVAAAEHYTHLAAAPHPSRHGTLKELDPEINPDRPPKTYKDAVSRLDREQWEEAMMKEYRGFQDMKALAIVKSPKGARLHDTMTRWEYKEENGNLVKYKVRITRRGDQQMEGESFVATDLYAPALKVHEARLLLAMAAAEGCSVYKTDTSQAFL